MVRRFVAFSIGLTAWMLLLTWGPLSDGGSWARHLVAGAGVMGFVTVMLWWMQRPGGMLDRKPGP